MDGVLVGNRSDPLGNDRALIEIFCHIVTRRPDQFHTSLVRGVIRSRSGERRERSEEHTSELQSLTNLVCRLLLEKKKKKKKQNKKTKTNKRRNWIGNKAKDKE